MNVPPGIRPKFPRPPLTAGFARYANTQVNNIDTTQAWSVINQYLYMETLMVRLRRKEKLKMHPLLEKTLDEILRCFRISVLDTEKSCNNTLNLA